MKMRIEHVNLVVDDIPSTLAFLRAALPSWDVRGEGDGHWYGTPRKWLHFGDSHHYITLNDHGSGPNRDLRGLSVGLAHIGMEVDDVDAVVERLRAAGHEPTTIGADHPHRKTVYFSEPAGFEFEFIQYLSDDPQERNLYGGETSGVSRVSTP